MNIYKPPNKPWPQILQISEQTPATYVGDFTSHHTFWGYANGIDLQNWADRNNLSLKDLATFKSARWQRGYNPDLCFVSRDAHDRPIKTK